MVGIWGWCGGVVGASDGRAPCAEIGGCQLGIGALVVVGEVYIELFLSLMATGRGYLQSEKQKQRRPDGPCKQQRVGLFTF